MKNNSDEKEKKSHVNNNFDDFFFYDLMDDIHMFSILYHELNCSTLSLVFFFWELFSDYKHIGGLTFEFNYI